VDFGCGRGYLAAQLDPFLPPGSHYTGIDVAAALLDDARRVAPGVNLERTFIQADAHRTPLADGAFDVAMCHSLLMHLSDPLEVLREMRRVTQPGGLMICCEANRSAVNASLFVEELPQLMDLGLLQRLFKRQREHSGKDPDIGVKLPVLFQRLGLENIQARITDSVRCVLPPLETDAQRSVFQAVRSEMPAPISEETAEAIRTRFEAIGLTREEADQQIRNEQRQAEEFASRGEQLHTVMPQMMLFCSGVVPGP
jgi:SAM-dependent methyltransferase